MDDENRGAAGVLAGHGPPVAQVGGVRTRLGDHGRPGAQPPRHPRQRPGRVADPRIEAQLEARPAGGALDRADDLLARPLDEHQVESTIPALGDAALTRRAAEQLAEELRERLFAELPPGA